MALVIIRQSARVGAMSEENLGEPIPPRSRRTKNYWEPMFDPGAGALALNKWQLSNNKGPTSALFRGEDLTAAVETGLKLVFDGIHFQQCDFQGTFDLSPREIVFKNCTFCGCDFGLTTWKKAKFTDCNFMSTSMSQSNWHQCEFRSCHWKNIGISGNSTDMSETVITNPDRFISAAYTNLNRTVLNENNKTAFYQRMRLETTKATVARVLLRTLTNLGDESAYYEALKVSSNQSSLARLWETVHELRTLRNWRLLPTTARLVLAMLEWAILNVAGSINAWGRSIARPFIVGLAITAIYAAIYWLTGIATTLPDAMIKAAEITLLTGYTNHSAGQLPAFEHFVVLSNMLFGVLWYVVFIPTLVNRISRVR